MKLTAKKHPAKKERLLIASLTPENLKRGPLWFAKNEANIKRAMHSNVWWQKNILLLQKDLFIKPSILAKKLLDLGYERAKEIPGRGTFCPKGGIVEVWPINTQHPYIIEFIGNTISAIHKHPVRKEKTPPKPSFASSLKRLVPGSFVVHIDHGIGIFVGYTNQQENTASNGKIKSLKIPQPAQKENYFIIKYAPPRPEGPPDLLYVPFNQKERLSPYIGFETPKIHRLGGSLWKKTKKKVKEDAQKLAKQLLELYAKRHKASRQPYKGDELLERELKLSFPYQETEDQLRAEQEILQDLEKTMPMDRILCGDVGFGKTEVALRAAMRVISSGKQVALIAPTTILAAQHKQTADKRLKKIPIKTALLSRIVPKTKQQRIIKDIAEGKIDLIIGTHRLLSSDVRFKKLGMVIIDEEQRFGVAQKEYFKKLHTEVDVLALSATPIPRTLHLALSKLRNISLIKTPLPQKLPIKTHVLPYSKQIIAKAILFELKRRGQVYFLHNRIETLPATQARLEQIIRKYNKNSIPPPKIEIIHGRMNEKQIIKTMNRFRQKKVDILIATTIIENGLDISNANTLIVDDAVKLGLAQAHQLRGRIGRGELQAFAYFLYRPKTLNPKASQRLEVLQEYADLGDGYEIALKDLEIRGAGNILGEEQSGAINKVGLNLYCQMLSEAIEKETKNG